MTLELMVARTVAWARVIERALHDKSDDWTFRTAGGITPASRLIDRDRAEIIFTGVVRPSPDGLVELCSGDDTVTLTTADLSKGDRISWRLSLKAPAPAS